MKTMTLNERLSHHCNKAIERGDGPISGIPAETEILRADRSQHNESNGKGMAGCIAKAGSVIAYFPTQSALRFAPLYAAAPDLLSALKALHSCHRAFSQNENWTTLDDEAREFAEIAIAEAEGSK